MKYIHRFRVKAPLAVVAAFHMQPASMEAITPPPMRVEVQHAPASLTSGGEMAFTLWFGPLPIRWTAWIENVSETGFSDRQVRGPFTEWVHHHSFAAVDERTTEVIDEISIRLKSNLFWGLVGFGFIIGLPVLFAYRGWKTRRLLERGRA